MSEVGTPDKDLGHDLASSSLPQIREYIDFVSKLGLDGVLRDALSGTITAPGAGDRTPQIELHMLRALGLKLVARRDELERRQRMAAEAARAKAQSDERLTIIAKVEETLSAMESEYGNNQNVQTVLAELRKRLRI